MRYRLFALLAVFSLAAQARLVRIEVWERSEVLGGQSFGKTGPYERIRGKAHFELDPSAAGNRQIVDLGKAKPNARGQVEFAADLYILMPRDPNAGNHTVLYEAPNRGGKGLLGMFNRARTSLDPREAEHFGDGLVLDEGYTLVWLGWQHDVPKRPNEMRLYAPNAESADGWVRSEFTPESAVSQFSLGDSGHTPYPVIKPGSLTLTVRDGIRGKRQVLKRDAWKLEADTTIALTRPATPGRIYEAVYQSADPAVAGAGLAGIRDLISFFKYGGSESVPLAERHGSIRHAIAFGTSQSAMLLKALVYEGFNADEQGRKVFDGIFAHVAGGRRTTLHRFAQPSRTAGPMRNASFSTTDQFPFADVTSTDPYSGLKDGLLAKAEKTGTVPKIIYTNSSYEYWGSVGALLHTSVDGRRDLPVPATSRVYLLSGGQHGPAAFPPKPGRGQNLANFNDYRWMHRALLRRLQLWVADGKEPPPSQHPSLADHTLVPREQYSFPDIPGVRLPAKPHVSQYLNFGPAYRKSGVIQQEPPKLGKAYAALVPQANPDGIDIAGVKMPWVSAPLGTFTGWNLRAPEIGAPDELLSQTGSFIPFAVTREARQASHDPRPSIGERYRSETDYLDQIRKAAEVLVQSGFLLDRDVTSVVGTARRYWQWCIQTATLSRR